MDADQTTEQEIRSRFLEHFQHVSVVAQKNYIGYYLITVTQDGNTYHLTYAIPDNFREMNYDYLAPLIEDFKREMNKLDALPDQLKKGREYFESPDKNAPDHSDFVAWAKYYFPNLTLSDAYIKFSEDHYRKLMKNADKETAKFIVTPPKKSPG